MKPTPFITLSLLYNTQKKFYFDLHYVANLNRQRIIKAYKQHADLCFSLLTGRLAMLAFLGFIVQHNVTGLGPFDNLLQHLSDPWHNTIIQTFSGN